MQQNEDGVNVLKYLNSKMTFGNWEMDVFMIIASGAGLALIVATSFWQMCILIIGSSWLAMKYQKIKEENVKGVFEHMLYHYGVREYPTLPPSHVKHYFG